MPMGMKFSFGKHFLGGVLAHLGFDDLFGDCVGNTDTYRRLAVSRGGKHSLGEQTYLPGDLYLCQVRLPELALSRLSPKLK